ncbi:MauE/DoxX family redox-associated membrane protein [Nonomuraea typhae]|uniref:MauE/DoxX family redox-associated membrane protein n=1 Tax=Nonomuraea typhae TaxID=2603600 RepID=A0ABW7YLW2_9ACTN
MSEPFELAADATRFCLAGVLLYSGSQKLAAPRAFRATVIALGMPKPRIVAAALPGLEIITALVLALPRAQPVGAALLVILGLAFAGAGVLAKARRTTVTCACFGQARSSRLGIRQLVYLPGWLGAAFLVLRGGHQPGVHQSLLIVALTGMCIGTVKLALTFPAVRENRIFVQASVRERSH